MTILGQLRVCRQSTRRILRLLSICVALLLLYVGLFRKNEAVPSSFHEGLQERHNNNNNNNRVTTKDYPDVASAFFKSKEKQACVQSKLEMYPSKEFIDHFPKPKCTHDRNWVSIDEGIFKISKSAININRNLKCDYIPILRGKDDFSYDYGNRRSAQDGAIVTSEVSKVKCSSDSGSYENYHITVPFVENLHKRSDEIQREKDALGLNVLMFGFDSVSRMTWMHKLPQTYAYMVDVLKFVVLEGYNILGDGTPQALLPMLTGHSETELPETRTGHPGATTVDVYPWIWNEFKKAGYVTQWVEDCATVGTFTHRMLGFKDAPVDHYVRHFYLEIERNLRNKYCLGSEYRHNVMLNYIKEFQKVYRNARKFSFGFHGDLSHDDNRPLSIVDEDLKKWLETLNTEGYLNNTLFILMADHGARFQHHRETVQGKQEERNPFFSFRLPDWFKQKYPRAFKNLGINSKRLTTPFDIHATFRDVLSFSDLSRANVSERGISLFSEIPASRTCEHAQIEPHWCNCLNWESVRKNSRNVQKAARVFINFVNNLTEPKRNECHALEIDNITDCSAYTPNKHFLKFKKSADNDGRTADMSAKTESDVTLYQLTIHTKPGAGHFEATVKHDLKSDNFTISVGDISRINKYGKDAECTVSRFPHLAPYCYCK